MYHMKVGSLNTKATAQDTGQLIQRLVPGIQMEWTTTGLAGPTTALRYAEIKKKIDANQLIIAFREGHACLISGYGMVNGDRETIFIHDPDKDTGPGQTYYSTYANGWVAHTFVTRVALSAETVWLNSVD